jgi:hypothetical protein
MKRAIFVLLLAGIAACAEAQVGAGAQERAGVCDSAVQREKKAVQFKVGSEKKGTADFAAERPCGGPEIHIRKCAVIEIKHQRTQRYCYPEDGKPQYADYFDVIEYWDAPR